HGTKHGHTTIGYFEIINERMIQLNQPLNFMGMVYREIKQAVIDIERMFTILAREPEIKDEPNAKPLVIKRGAIRFENVSFAYEPDRQILNRLTSQCPAACHVPVARRS